MAKQVPWDDDTDGFISDLDTNFSKKYNMPIRSLLMNPAKYLGKKDLSTAIDGIRADADNYFTTLLGGLKDEEAKLETELERADSQYREVDNVITNKAAVSRVPYIKPLAVSRNPNSEETIVIDNYEEGMEGFVGKLVSVSNYVADMSAVYKQHRLGSWMFSGTKNHVLTINPPSSPVLIIDNSRNIINGLLDDIESRASA